MLISLFFYLSFVFLPEYTLPAVLFFGKVKKTDRREGGQEEEHGGHFLTMINSFCTGQNILVDGGESINYNFVWKKD